MCINIDKLPSTCPLTSSDRDARFADDSMARLSNFPMNSIFVFFRDRCVALRVEKWISSKQFPILDFNLNLRPLVCIVDGNEVTEEPVTGSVSIGIIFQQEYEQNHADEEKEDEKSTESTVEVANATTAVTIATNVTRVNCSSDKIHGPVEVRRVALHLFHQCCTKMCSKNDIFLPRYRSLMPRD